MTTQTKTQQELVMKEVRIDIQTINSVLVSVENDKVDEFINSFKKRYDEPLYDEDGKGILDENTIKVGGIIKTFNHYYDVNVDMEVQ